MDPFETSTTTTTDNDNPPEPTPAQQPGIPLPRCPNIHLITSTPKGRGIFATAPIPSGTLIDICPVLILDPTENVQHIEKTQLYHYTYNWPMKPTPLTTTTTINGSSSTTTTTRTTQAVVFGLGSMFNHSRNQQNVGWQRDVANELIVYRALRDIARGEELCISYGDHLTFVDADDDGDMNGMDGGEEAETEEGVLGRIQWET